MPHEIEVTIQGDPAEWFARAQKELAGQGVSLDGDCTSGTFAGKGFSGRYSVQGQRLLLVIEKKPLLVPWSLVEMSVRAYFG